MTVRYVGPGGNNGNSGLTWALRKLTLAGVEATVAAGDTVYVGPGVYRETLTTSVNGTNGNPITYIADITGINTDGVGGVVRVTGSDNDQTATRANGISIGHNFRTFRGFSADTTTATFIAITAGANAIIEDFAGLNANTGISIAGAGQANHTVRRCLLIGVRNNGIFISHTSNLSNVGHVIENCVVIGTQAGEGIRTDRVGGITARNCLLLGCLRGGRVGIALTAGQMLTMNNCVFASCTTGVLATVAGELVEDYNSFFNNNADRTNVNVGANSVNYSPVMAGPMLVSGSIFTWIFGMLRPDSPLASIAGTGVASDDLYGTTRVATSSWGPVQYIAGQRPTDAGQPRGRQS